MSSSKFEDKYIRISDLGIEFLRNLFVYEHFDFEEIKMIKIKKGHTIKRWKITLLIGLLFTCTSIYILMTVFINLKYFNPNLQPPPSIRSALTIYIAVFFLAGFGILMIFQAINKSLILHIIRKNKENRFSLKEFEKNNEVNALINFLESKNVKVEKDYSKIN